MTLTALCTRTQDGVPFRHDQSCSVQMSSPGTSTVWWTRWVKRTKSLVLTDRDGTGVVVGSRTPDEVGPWLVSLPYVQVGTLCVSRRSSAGTGFLGDPGRFQKNLTSTSTPEKDGFRGGRSGRRTRLPRRRKRSDGKKGSIYEEGICRTCRLVQNRGRKAVWVWLCHKTYKRLYTFGTFSRINNKRHIVTRSGGGDFSFFFQS